MVTLDLARCGSSHRPLPVRSKLVTLIVSLFTSAYVFLWPKYFPNSPLVFEELPVFDGR